MKATTGQLNRELNTKRIFTCCDLFTLTLNNQKTFRAADFDIDVTYQGNTYYHDRFLMKRDQTKSTGEPVVETLSVNIFADQHHVYDFLDGKYVSLAAHDGTLDDSTLTLGRAFFTSDTGKLELLGVIYLFTGRCEVSECEGGCVKLTVKAETTGLNAKIPRRIYAPQNVYMSNNRAGVMTSSSDNKTCMVPLKPNASVLLRF